MIFSTFLRVELSVEQQSKLFQFSAFSVQLFFTLRSLSALKQINRNKQTNKQTEK